MKNKNVYVLLVYDSEFYRIPIAVSNSKEILIEKFKEFEERHKDSESYDLSLGYDISTVLYYEEENSNEK